MRINRKNRETPTTQPITIPAMAPVDRLEPLLLLELVLPGQEGQEGQTLVPADDDSPPPPLPVLLLVLVLGPEPEPEKDSPGNTRSATRPRTPGGVLQEQVG